MSRFVYSSFLLVHTADWLGKALVALWSTHSWFRQKRLRLSDRFFLNSDLSYSPLTECSPFRRPPLDTAHDNFLRHFVEPVEGNAMRL